MMRKSSLLKYIGKLDYEIYVTRARGDATRFIKKWCSTHWKKVRVYACGGDGTLNEVVNGIGVNTVPMQGIASSS